MLALSASSAWAFDLPELMGLLAQQKSGEARFTEQRFVRGLEGPLEASGVLSFTAPDKLVRRTLAPRPETMSVEGNTLTLSRGSRTRTLQLDSMPELLGMVEAMRGTLSGNSQGLQRYFRSTLSGSSNSWTLDLQPVDERLAAQVRTMRLSGRGGEVLGIEMEFIGGDRSVMNITPERGTGGPARTPARSAP
ncbi:MULTISPECIES: LolA-related protein [unclassified Variovorax]|uniref:LolA-related protein n=1 Tax=unclassified Variovorax TaxID=663243 RepID=UPI003015842B